MKPVEIKQLKGIDFHISENQIKNTLVYYNQHFPCFRYIKCVAMLDEKATILAKRIYDNPKNKYRPLVSYLTDKLPAHKLF